MSDLEKRIASLEAINNIENLKHTYLNACDAKDVQTMMLTFKEGSCHIDYGKVGLFNNREDLAKLFETSNAFLKFLFSFISILYIPDTV